MRGRINKDIERRDVVKRERKERVSVREKEGEKERGMKEKRES